MKHWHGKNTSNMSVFSVIFRHRPVLPIFQKPVPKIYNNFLFYFFLLGPGRRSRSFCGENVATFNLRGGGQESWNHEIRKRCADDREFKFCFCRIARFYQLLQMVKKYTKIIIFKRYCHTLY